MSQATARDLEQELDEPIDASTDPSAAASDHIIQYGIEDNPELDALLDRLPTNPEDLPEGGLSKFDGTILGMRFDPGGEERTGDDGKPWTTSPQVILSVRVDNKEDIGYPFDATDIYLPMPSKSPTSSKAADPTKSSKYGIFMDALDYCGVSGNVGNAHAFLLPNFKNIVGFMGHFERKTFQLYKGRTTDMVVPTEVYGFDNDLRGGLKVPLPPAYLIGQEPGTTPTVKARTK